MTANKVVTLWCDVEGCVEMYSIESQYMPATRRYARDRGWRSEEDRDFCPRHASLFGVDEGASGG
jgi:hypothetical protein